jgi:hypothetical protein
MLRVEHAKMFLGLCRLTKKGLNSQEAQCVLFGHSSHSQQKRKTLRKNLHYYVGQGS